MWSLYTTTNAGAVGGDRWLVDLCERALEVRDGVPPHVRARVLAVRELSGYWIPDEEIDLARSDEAMQLATESGEPVALVLAALAHWWAQVTVSRPPPDGWPNFLAAVERARTATEDRHFQGMAAVYTSWGAAAVGDHDQFERALQRIEEAHAALGTERMQSWALWCRTAIALRVGDWDEALATTTEARAVTIDRMIGAITWQQHMAVIALHRGTIATLLPAVPKREDATTYDASLKAWLALIQAHAGLLDDAHATLRALVTDRSLARNPTGIGVRGLAAWAAAITGAVDLAPPLIGLLEPVSGMMASGPNLELGSTDRMLAMLLALQGRHDEALPLYRSGLELEERFRAPVLATHTRLWWARSLLARDEAGDREQAGDLLRQCLEVADRLDMAGVASDARAELSRL
jgi:tetratricopeptide (TPR) repeat protein